MNRVPFEITDTKKASQLNKDSSSQIESFGYKTLGNGI